MTMNSKLNQRLTAAITDGDISRDAGEIAASLTENPLVERRRCP